VALAVHEWGDPAAPQVACLHGVTGHGRHFAGLAERLAARFHVVAPDLLGHGDSPYEPPWSIEAQLTAITAALLPGPLRCVIGHSFGGRLAFELAAASPGLADRLVLLDPAIWLPAHVALHAAEEACHDRSYASFEEAVELRYDESALREAPRQLLEEELAVHLVTGGDGRWRYRYCVPAVIASYGELARRPPAFARVRLPTLLLLGEHSYLSYDHLVDQHRAAAGDLLEIVTVDGGHTVLWDAFEETAAAVDAFLSET
jgi:lipase